MKSHLSSVSITVGGEEALGPSVALAHECYGQSSEPPEWWKWFLFGLDGTQTSIVLAKEGDKVVGIQLLVISRFVRKAEQLKGASLFGGMVHPDFRRKGIFRSLVTASLQEAWRQGADFALTMPNNRSYLAFQSFGWKDLGERSLFATLALCPSWRQRHREDLRTEVVPSFAGDAGGFCQSVLEKAAALGQPRSAEWLQWRFGGNPLGHYVQVECRDGSRTLRGIAVGRVVRRGPIKVGMIIDALAEAEDAIREAMAGLCDAMRREGAAVVAAVFGRGKIASTLSSLGFMRVPWKLSPKRFYTVFQVNPGSPKARFISADPSDWYLSLADWDGI